MAARELPHAAPLLEGPKLRRELRLIDALSIIVGIIVGTGIFTTPGVVLAQAGSVGEGLLAWLVAGAISLCIAFLYAELGTSIPVASGDAEFLKGVRPFLHANSDRGDPKTQSSFASDGLKECNFRAFLTCFLPILTKIAFGPSWSFSFIWTSFLVLYSGSINIFATSLAQYFLAATCYADFSTQDMEGDGRITYIALASVVGVTICNCAGVRFGSFLQNFLGLCKAFLVLVILTVAAIFLTRGTTLLEANFSRPFMGSSFIGFGPSMVAALWAFNGFDNIVFLTEEMKNPSRDVPRASFGAIFLVTSGYLAVNLSYLSVLPISDVKKSFIVAMDSTKAVLGQQAGRFTAILVALSLLGSLNALILCGGRYLYSAARDGHYYGGWLGQVNEHNGAPILALIAQVTPGVTGAAGLELYVTPSIVQFSQGVWCAFLLLLSTDVVKLLNYFSIASFLFTALIAVAHWKLRYQFPALSRPFRVPFHPLLNIFVLLSSMYMIATSISADPVPTIGSLIFTFSSFPVYHIFVKKKSLEPVPDDENAPLLS